MVMDNSLSAEQRQHFTQVLQTEADRLRGLLRGFTEEAGGQEQDENQGANSEDLAEQNALNDQYQAQAQDLLEALRQVQQAQSRLESGSFGRCADCGQPIPLARLEARPTAERCISCEQRRETRHRGGR